MAKRVVDLLFAVLAFVLSFPVLLLCAVALKLESPRAPVLFAQERTGRDGQRFRMYKFRTMVPNADHLKIQLAAQNQRQWPDFKVDNDPRITRVGRVLRRASIDEVPQLLNILAGQMSLVGPRPTSFASSTLQPWQHERLDVRPGVTGLWQVAGRDTESFAERMRLDIAYVERRTMLLDLVILLKTVPTVLFGRGSV